MKIGYITPSNPFIDKKSWSGTYYKTREALELAGHNVEWIPYNENTLSIKIFRKLYRILFGRGSFTHSRISGLIKSKSIKKDLSQYDLIFIPGQVDIVASIKTNTPILYMTDGTIPLMIDYYWFGFTKRSIKEAEKVELKALQNSTYNVFSSYWAKHSAEKDYNISLNKLFMVPFGANINENDIEYKQRNTPSKTINLLFSGVNWERKGGEIAVNAVKNLVEKGYDAKLLICGIKNLDENIANLPYVENLGFLNKEDNVQYKRYIDAFRKADLFILPTKAECSAIVFNEASAFGVPSLTYDTGGLADYVYNDINGYRLPLSSTSQDFSSKIIEIIEHNLLPQLSQGARNQYLEKNSWKSWGKKINKLLKL